MKTLQDARVDNPYDNGTAHLQSIPDYAPAPPSQLITATTLFYNRDN